MAQNTWVAELTPAQAAALERRLRDLLPHPEWRRVPHARFSVKSSGVVVTCYESGKLVLQGSNLEMFRHRFLGDLAGDPGSGSSASSAPLAGRSSPRLVDASIGSDEAGKGDYFGPLVVAAVHAAEDDLAWLRALRVADSKTVTDGRAHALAGQIQQRLDNRVVSLMPDDYNRAHASTGNLNTVLAGLHADALAPLIHLHPGDSVLVDKFADDGTVARALAERKATPCRLTCMPRAEEHPVVAAASLLARSAFLQGLAECSDLCGTDLHKGAGAPVDRVASRVFEIGGRKLLARVAKLHFRNTQKLGH